MRRVACILALLAGVSCAPAQRAPIRTALDVNVCLTQVALRHVEAGDDFKDPVFLATLATELAIECAPAAQKAAE